MGKSKGDSGSNSVNIMIMTSCDGGAMVRPKGSKISQKHRL